MAIRQVKMTDLHWEYFTAVEESLGVANDYQALVRSHNNLLAMLNRISAAVEAIPPDPTTYAFKGRQISEIRDEHTQYFYQQTLVRGYEGYLTYLKGLHELLYATIHKGLVISDPATDELIGSLLMSRQALRSRHNDLIADLRDQFSLPILEDKADRQFESRIAGIRDMIIHNKAKMSKNWVGNQPDFKLKEGELLIFTTEIIQRYLAKLLSWVLRLDNATINRFSLPYVIRDVIVPD